MKVLTGTMVSVDLVVFYSVLIYVILNVKNLTIGAFKWYKDPRRDFSEAVLRTYIETRPLMLLVGAVEIYAHGLKDFF